MKVPRSGERIEHPRRVLRGWLEGLGRQGEPRSMQTEAAEAVDELFGSAS